MTFSSVMCKSVLKRSAIIGSSGVPRVWFFTLFSGASFFSFPVLVKSPVEPILHLQTTLALRLHKLVQEFP